MPDYKVRVQVDNGTSKTTREVKVVAPSMDEAPELAFPLVKLDGVKTALSVDRVEN